jgi:ABC-type multidrug transport system fused ATPase/permease subunit
VICLAVIDPYRLLASWLQCGKFIQLFSTFVGGYVVAFIRSWKLTLVVMAVMPVLIGVGGTTAVGISKMAARSQASYANAGTLVEQVVSSIRTVRLLWPHSFFGSCFKRL